MLPNIINATQTECEAPVDQALMDAIRLDLNYLDNALTNQPGPPYGFVVNGRLTAIPGGIAKNLDATHTGQAQTFQILRASLKRSGLTGFLSVDVHKHSHPKTPITAIINQFKDDVTDVSRVNSTLSTQTIARATTQVLTQSIARAKTALNVNSIIQNQNGTWRYNLASAPDADWIVGASVTFSSCTSGGNNITAPILEIDQSGYPSIVVSNPTGVAQTSAAGSADLNLWSYNYTNPVSATFVPGEQALFGSHTSANNDGSLPIYAINVAGNNIWVFNILGVAQAGVAGNVNVQRWIYHLSATVPVQDYVVGEKMLAVGHTSANNDGSFQIKVISTSNITIYNTSGIAQGAPAGSVDSQRWVFTFTNDPAGLVSIGDNYTTYNLVSGGNNLSQAVVVQVKRGGNNNLVFYNESGSTQALTQGTVRSWRKLVKFPSDVSAQYSLTSFIEMKGTVDPLYEISTLSFGYKVLQINRGGGANYNVVIEEGRSDDQLSPAGWIILEHRSLLNNPLVMLPDLVSLEENRLQFALSSDFVVAQTPANTQLGLYFKTTMTGVPTDLTVELQ